MLSSLGVDAGRHSACLVRIDGEVLGSVVVTSLAPARAGQRIHACPPDPQALAALREATVLDERPLDSTVADVIADSQPSPFDGPAAWATWTARSTALTAAIRAGLPMPTLPAEVRR